MNIQYPHNILCQIPDIANTPVQDSLGKWVQPAPIEDIVIEQYGRAEPNGTGQKIAGVNGDQIVYDWTIFFPVTAEEVSFGAKVFIYSEGKLTGTGTVKRWQRDAFDCKIWV